VGATGSYREVADRLVKNGADVILIDVAHGHHSHVERAIKTLRKEVYRLGDFEFDIIAGNVATGQAAWELAKWGADAIRVGVGNGSVCSTRVKTGVGVGQITAIQEVYEELRACGFGDIPIIADGGVRQPGDAAKAIAAGADTVMVGSVLAGTDETPGELKARETDWPDRELYKEYRGSASQGVKGSDRYVEGVTRTVPYRGSVRRIISDMKDGLRSSFSYVGAKSVSEFQEKANLEEVSGATSDMGRPHHSS
jgi:IMP dehydrogenase